jgi:alkanesulfonate monooxygenase SsuD/methylene tetrahydromethanopterin reductase-like flavin-dependent oxidoreductase (luciferase family)
MHVGMFLMFQNPGGISDAQLYAEEVRLADQAESLGYDSIWTVEHHFTDYAVTPDPMQFLTYMAGRTSRVQLGSMVAVLPWHDPVRVAEQAAVLDLLSGGRAILGIGRGLGRIEFEGLRIPMGESRTRFVEAAKIILGALETGRLEFDGEHFQQPARDLRPAAPSSFKGRVYASAVSPESVKIMAQLGVGMMVIPQKPYELVAKDLVSYRQTFREVNGEDAPPTRAAMYVYCDENEDRAQELGRKHIGDYYKSTMKHYEMAGSHFKNTKGYEFYERVSENVNKFGADAAEEAFVNLHVFGTPEQCYAKVIQNRLAMGAESIMVSFKYASIDIEDAERNCGLFSREVRPELAKLGPIELDAVLTS